MMTYSLNRPGEIKCPYCHVAIDHLSANDEERQYYSFYIYPIGDPHGSFESESDDSETIGGSFSGYYCPECKEVLTHDMGAAEEFLRSGVLEE